MPNLIMYQNTCFAIQALVYSTLDQKWDGSIYHGLITSVKAIPYYFFEVGNKIN